MALPVVRSAADVFEQMHAVLAAELPAVLAAYRQARGYVWPYPAQVEYTGEVPRALNDTPALFMSETSAPPASVAATGSVDIERQIVIGLIVAAGVLDYAPGYTGPRDTETLYMQATRDYVAAVRYVLTDWLPRAPYGPLCGVWRASPGSDAPIVLPESAERDAWMQAWAIDVLCTQRLAYSAAAATPLPLPVPLVTDLGDPILTDSLDPIVV